MLQVGWCTITHLDVSRPCRAFSAIAHRTSATTWWKESREDPSFGTMQSKKSPHRTHGAKETTDILNLGGGNSNIFLCSPRKLGKISNLTSIFFNWVETTNQSYLFSFIILVFKITMCRLYTYHQSSYFKQSFDSFLLPPKHRKRLEVVRSHSEDFHSDTSWHEYLNVYSRQNPWDPWDDCIIYLHGWLIFMVSKRIGKYTKLGSFGKRHHESWLYNPRVVKFQFLIAGSPRTATAFLGCSFPSRETISGSCLPPYSARTKEVKGQKHSLTFLSSWIWVDRPAKKLQLLTCLAAHVDRLLIGWTNPNHIGYVWVGPYNPGPKKDASHTLALQGWTMPWRMTWLNPCKRVWSRSEQKGHVWFWGVWQI